MRRGEHPRACFTVAKLDPRRGAIEDRAGSSVAEAGRAYHRFHPRARGSSRGATRPHGADRTGAPDGRPSRGRALGPPSAPRSTERDPQQMTSRTVAGNGPRARDRSGVRRTARGRCRRRPCRRRCGGRRRAVDGGEARRTGSDTFCARAVWMLAGSRAGCDVRVVLPGNARATLARSVHAESRRTLGAATRAAMEALITAAILSTVGRATGGGWVLEYRRCRARVALYRLRFSIRLRRSPRRSLIGR